MANWRSEIKTIFENFAAIALGSGLKHFGPWNNQKNNSNTEETKGPLGVFFEFSNIGEGLPYLLETNMQQSQRIPVLVTLHVMFNSFSEEYQNLAYDYADKITLEISGRKNEYVHGRIMKVGEVEDTSHRGEYDYQINFAFFIKEAVFKSGLDALIDGNPATGENPATGRKLFVNINGIAPTPTPVYYNLTTIAGANGSVIPEVTDLPVLDGEAVAIYADPDPGFRFSKFIKNDVDSFVNPLAFNIDVNTTVLAEFIVSIIKQLQIAVSGTGTTNPIPGNYDREQGTFQLIEAIETDVLYYFDEFKQDGTPLVGNPVNVEITDNTLVVAYFLEYLQYLFGDAPQKVVDLYYWINQSSFNLPVQIKQSQVLYFNGLAYGDSGVFMQGQTPINITAYVDNIPDIQPYGILGCGAYIDADKGIRLLIFNNQVYVLIGNGITRQTIIVNGIIFSIVKKVQVIWNGLIGGNVQIIINNIVYNYTATHEWTGNSSHVTYYGSQKGIIQRFKGEIHRIINEGYFEYNFKESWGTENIDRSGLGNHGTMIGFNETEAWSVKSDKAEPLESYAYTLFQQIADPTKFIRAIYDTLGNSTKTTITGYTNEGEIPANVVSNTGAVYSGIQIVGLEVDATFTEVLAIENSTTVEITKDANTVSLLKIKQ